ncbi:rab-GTPase-TBC domain-containing protein [Spinellus fusiger]|nr:rab-GTPase-TBC domain-containing protein [Spinellus fusiger]
MQKVDKTQPTTDLLCCVESVEESAESAESGCTKDALSHDTHSHSTSSHSTSYCDGTTTLFTPDPQPKEPSLQSQYRSSCLHTAEIEDWFTAADRYGFIKETRTLTNKQVEKEVERAAKWATMATHKTTQQQDMYYTFLWTRKFVNRVYKGIPDCWRRDAWYYMCTEQLQTAAQDTVLRTTYTNLLQSPSEHERQIDLDIPRTMGDHIMFRQRYGSGQRSLFNMLRAFSNYDPQVGYCQGMTNIAATILMYYEEEKAFLVLVHMFLRDPLHDLYRPGFPMLLESFFIQEGLLEYYLPKLYRHLNALGVGSDLYATRWYITLFTGGILPCQTLLRVWDIYFLCGFDIFYVVAVVLLKTMQDQLIKGEFEDCMQLLGTAVVVKDDDLLIATVRRLYDKIQRHGIFASLKQHYKTQRLETW